MVAIPTFPQNYGWDGTNLIWPVVLVVERIDRANRDTPEPMYDDLYDEHIIEPDGTNLVRYLPQEFILGQFLPPSATDRLSKADPGISGIDMDYKAAWALSDSDLEAKGLIDATTRQPLLQPGDRLVETRKAIPGGGVGDLLVAFTDAEITFRMFLGRHPGGTRPLFTALFEDKSQTSKILS